MASRTFPTPLHKYRSLIAMLAKAHTANSIVKRNDAGDVSAHIIAHAKYLTVRGCEVLGDRTASWFTSKGREVGSGYSGLYLGTPNLADLDIPSLTGCWHNGKRDVERTGFTAQQLNALDQVYYAAEDEFVGLVVVADLLAKQLNLTLTVDEKVQILYAHKS